MLLNDRGKLSAVVLIFKFNSEVRCLTNTVEELKYKVTRIVLHSLNRRSWILVNRTFSK